MAKPPGAWRSTAKPGRVLDDEPTSTAAPSAVPASAAAPSAAAAVAELFPAIYRRLHSRFDAGRVGVRAAVLLDHLSMSGPLTVGEIAEHLSCVQSVASEVVDGLEARGLLERMQDARDRRRTLVWLTPKGLEWCERSREVLAVDRLRVAMAAMSAHDRAALVEGMRALVHAADGAFAPALTSRRSKSARTKVGSTAKAAERRISKGKKP